MTRASVSSKSLLVLFISIAATFTALLGFSATANAQLDTFGTGNGSAGAFTAGAGTTTLNHAAPITAAASSGATTLTVGTERTGGYAGQANLAANRLVLVIQSTGFTGTATDGSAAAIDLSSDAVGRWELARVQSYAAPTVTLTSPLVNSYGATGAQIVTIPEFTTASIAAGQTVNGPAWDGSSGGIVGFLATGAVTVNGSLTSAGRGFRQGTVRNTTATGCAQLVQGNNNRKGEGIVPSYYDAAGGDTSNGVGYGNKANGAGGGNCAEGGGGGGSNAGAGGKGGNSSDGNRDVGGRGGAPLTYSAYDHFVFGGGGGSGDDNSGQNGAGGIGGGIVFVRGASLAGTGSITAAGANGANSGNRQASAGGGAAGGVVYARFAGALNLTTITAAGGNGGSTPASGFSSDGTGGGGGGGGRLLLQGTSVTATTSVAGGANGVNHAGAADGAVAGSAGSTTSNATGFVKPAAAITSPANGTYVANTGPTISGTATANSTVHIHLDGVEVGTATANGSGNWTYNTAGLAQGAHTVWVQSVLDSSWSDPTSTNTFTVDTVSPSVSISSPTNGSYTNDNTPSVSFTATDTNAGTTTCAVDAGAYSSCSSPWTTSALSDGVHTLNVRHTDLAGNVTTSSVSITVDTTAPLVELNGPADGSITNDNTPTLDYMVSDLNFGTTTCSVDGGAFGACVSPMAALSNGVHTIAMRHVDLAGNTTTVTNTFTVDTTPPTVNVTPPPALTNSTASIDVSFTAGDNVAVDTVECQTNSGGYAPCTSPYATGVLVEGTNNIYVRVTDTAGNVTVQSVSFTVDSIAPVAPAITSPTDGTVTSDNTPTISGTAEANSTVEVFADGSSLGTTTADGSGNWSFTPGSPLSDDTYEFTATATDAAGNESVPSNAVDVTVDTTAPNAPAITTPTDGTVTGDNTPTVSGTAEPNSTVEVFADGNSLGTTTADGSGNWSFTPGSPLSDDTYEFTATATDSAGNESAASNGVNVTIDTVAPAAPAITSPADGATTNDTTPTISGTAEAGSTVEVFADGNSLGTTTADGSGNWSLTPGTPMAPGTYDLTATSTDAAGNESVESAAVELTIDVTTPTVDITAPANAAILNDATPTIEFSAADDGPLTIECSVDGGAWVACGPTDFTTGSLTDATHSVAVRATDAGGNVGQAVVNFTVDTVAPNAPVISSPLSGTITSDNTPTISGTAEANSTVIVYADSIAVGSTTADGSGNWTFTPAGPQPDGTYDITATSTDAAGNVSADSNTVELTIDTVAPAAPSITSPTDGTVTSDTTPTISGTAEANSTVEVFADGNSLGTTTVDGSGNWSFTPGTPLADGEYEFTATATDAADNTSAPSAGVDVTIDTGAPAAPVINSPADGSVTGDNTPTISGTAEAGSTVEIFADGNSLGTTTADGSGNWSFTPGTPLADGEYEFTATATDTVGNEGPSSAGVDVTIDTTAPSAPAINSPADGTVTNDNTPTISGTAEAGSTVEVFADGNSLGTTTVDGSGNWSFTPGTPLGDATYEFTATATDAAGNESAASNDVDVTIDTAAPAAPVIVSPLDGSSTNDTTPAISGTAEAGSTVEVFVDGVSIGSVTADGSGNWSIVSGVLAAGDRVITATATDEAGNESPESAPVTVTIDVSNPVVAISSPTDGAVLNDNTPQITFLATDNGALTIECSVDSGPWVPCGPTTYTTDPLLDGAHDVTVRATDSAGNVGTAFIAFSVDTAAPAAPVISSPADESVTNDNTPTISGTAEANSTVEVFADGNSLGTTTADGSGNWSFTPSSPLSDDTYEFTATATDVAGNTSATSNAVDVTIDTVAPNAPSIDTPADDSVSSDNTPTISGTAEANSLVTIYADGNALGTTNADGSGNWSFTPAAPLADDTYEFTATATDAANNVSGDSNAVDHTIDTVAPSAPAITSPADGAVTADNTPTISGTAEPNSTVEVFADGNSLGTTTADGSGNWSFTPGTPLSDDTYEFTATATDAAANESAPSTGVDVTIDTVAPNAPAIDSPVDGSTTGDNTPEINGTAEPNSTVTIYVDGNPVGTATADGSGDWTFTPSTPLSDGPHVITADTEDAAGNTSAASTPATVTIDTTAPATTIDSGPNSPTSSTDATFTFSSDEPGVTYECSLDGAPFTTCTSPLNLTGLGDGSHTLEVRAIDEAGNEDASPASYSWTVDTTPPNVPVVTAPTNGQVTNDTTPTISGTAEPGSTVTVYVDGNPIGTAVANGSGNWTLTSPVLAEGGHAIVATATDDLGNTSGNSTTVNFTVDTTPPDGAVVKQNGTGNPSQPASFDISSDDPNATMTCSVNGATPVSCGSTYTASGLAPGSYTLVVVFTDEAGNSSSRSINFTVVGNPTAPTPPPTAAPIDALPAACFPKGITIYELAIKGSKLTIKGFARSQYIGQEVTINFQPTKNKVIGKTKVQPDGSFSLTVKAPAKKLRTKGSSRYRANVGGESSLWFKLARRMGSNLATYSNGKLNVAGALTKPLDPKATLTVTVRTGCNDPWAKVGTTKVGKSGSFKAAMPLTTDSKVLFVRMYAKVRKSAKGKATLTTYSFVVPVVTGR